MEGIIGDTAGTERGRDGVVGTSNRLSSTPKANMDGMARTSNGWITGRMRATSSRTLRA